MFVIWQWMKRGQSGLLIQLQFIACVFFNMITSLSCILIIDLTFAMQLQLIFTLFLLNILYLWLFELKEGNNY